MGRILETEHLKTVFRTQNGIVKAARDVSFHVDEGEVLGIVGESGSGKSVCMLSIMGLLASTGFISGGTVRFDGQTMLDVPADSFPAEPADADFRKLSRIKKEYERRVRKLRGASIGMVFQDPMTFLNPVLTIGYQLTEGIRNHRHISKREAQEKSLEQLKLVGVTDPERRLSQYPFELSGGMRQRIMIAMALMCEPKLLIADEPTTALDVTIQAQILDLMKDLQERTGMSIIMITHDLGVVASMCSRIVIMYGGQVMEEGTDREIFYEPKHPYTKGLLNSINSTEEEENEAEKKRLEPIPGSPPDLLAPPAGCAFVDRCEYAMKLCKEHAPYETEFSGTHRCRCWLHDQKVQELLREEGR